MIRLDLSERDVELIEVALQSAISACAGFRAMEGLDSTDDLAGEYQATLRRVQRGGE